MIDRLPTAARLPRLRAGTPALPRIGTALVVAGAGLYVLAMLLVMSTRSYDLWGGLLFAPVLVLVSLPALRAIARSDGTSGILTVLVWAVVLKMLAAGARYWMAFVLYSGSDAVGYHTSGLEIAERLRHGLSPGLGVIPTGTDFMQLVSGVAYVAIGPSLLGGMVVFAWLGFWGLVLVWRAFRIAVPDGDGHRYALIVFLLPSMLFWPSALGKEAVMSLFLGGCALGAARLFAAQRGWIVPLALGLAGMALLRPHFAAMAFCGLFAGYLVRAPSRRTLLTPILKVGGVVALLLVGLVVARQAAQFFDVAPTAAGFGEALNTTASRTETGGATFSAQPVRTPLDLPQAILTVAFRPFPWEADSAQAVLQSLESVFILGLMAASWRRLRGFGHRLRAQPYIAFCLVYSLFFVYAYSTFGNFGILARQRVLLYPFLLVLLCLPDTSRRRVSVRAQ